MGLFNFFKKENTLDKFYKDSYEKLFPNGKKQIEEMGNGIVQLFNNKIDLEEAENCYTQIKFRLHMTVSFRTGEEKNLQYFLDVINKYCNGKLDNDEAWKLMRYILENDTMTYMYIGMIGLLNAASDFDEIPDGKGEFGYTLENPIPVKGVMSNKIYLEKLCTQDGNNITYNRIGSYKSENLGKTTDGYEIFGNDGKLITTLYICPYYGKTSTKAPTGFFLK